MAKTALIAFDHNAETNVITFTVGDAGTVTLDVNALADDIRTDALIHGLRQKITDAAAMPKSELTGDLTKDAAAKLNAMETVAARLRDGNWTRVAGEGSGNVSGVTFLALVEYDAIRAKSSKRKPHSADELREKLNAMDKKSQSAFRKIPEVAAIIERIKSERNANAPAVDATALLGELGI